MTSLNARGTRISKAFSPEPGEDKNGQLLFRPSTWTVFKLALPLQLDSQYVCQEELSGILF